MQRKLDKLISGIWSFNRGRDPTKECKVREFTTQRKQFRTSQKNYKCSLQYLTFLKENLPQESVRLLCVKLCPGVLWSGHDKGKNIWYLDRQELCYLGLPWTWPSFGRRPFVMGSVIENWMYQQRSIYEHWDLANAWEARDHNPKRGWQNRRNRDEERAWGVF